MQLTIYRDIGIFRDSSKINISIYLQCHEADIIDLTAFWGILKCRLIYLTFFI